MGAKASFFVSVPIVIPLRYLVSALFHGVSYSGLEAGGRWALFAAGVALSATMAPAWRQRLLHAVAWIGVASSVLGLVVADPAFQPLGWSNAGRLQFFFQYANAVGAWFSMAAALSWFSDDRLLRRFACLPVSCLLLTQSGGCVCSICDCVFAHGRRGSSETGDRGPSLARVAASRCRCDFLFLRVGFCSRRATRRCLRHCDVPSRASA